MSPPRQIRVIVGEDQAFVREGIVHVLTDGGFDVVGTTAHAHDLVRMASAYGPDVAVADIQMPPAMPMRGYRPHSRSMPPSPEWWCWSYPSSSRTATSSTSWLTALGCQESTEVCDGQFLLRQERARGAGLEDLGRNVIHAG